VSVCEKIVPLGITLLEVMPWKLEFECRIAPARCGETADRELRGAPGIRRSFPPNLATQQVCIMKLSHFGDSLQENS
jgi:hypothetical protein